MKTGRLNFSAMLHGAEGLAVALGFGRAELAGDALLEGAALEVGDDEDGLAVEEGHAAGHRGIVAEGAVAVDFAEVGEECVDEVHRIGALRVPGQLRSDPCFGDRCGWRVRVRCFACFVFCHLNHCI